MARSDISRRSVLASISAAPAATVLARSAAEGFDPPVATEAFFSAQIQLRLAAPTDALTGSAVIVGGEASGAFAAQVLPGSFAWTRDPARAVLERAARFDLQGQDGLRIQVTDFCTLTTQSAACWEAAFSTQPQLTVVDGSSPAFREALYLGRMDASQIQAGRLRLDVYRVL